MKTYKSGNNNQTADDLQFERALEEYKVVIRKLRVKAVRKYGSRANSWFGVK